MKNNCEKSPPKFSTARAIHNQFKDIYVKAYSALVSVYVYPTKRKEEFSLVRDMHASLVSVYIYPTQRKTRSFSSVGWKNTQSANQSFLLEH